MNKLIILLLTFFLINNCFSQDTLGTNEKYGDHKKIIDDYRTPILIALSHYPKLIDTKIKFEQMSIESTGKSTISFPSILCKRGRKYIIKINNDKTRTGFLLKELSLNQQIAVFGHELAHIEDFSNRNFLKMIFWGLHYQNKAKRKKIERTTDQSTIEHGMGNELYEWSSFVLSSNRTSAAYKEMRLYFYLHPDEILKLIPKF